ncbi:MAG TPA: hypothetical protein VGU64_06930 [Terriglobales bacterium]|nr:hypothetical protein [Terriglobales bacterium]
MLRLERDCEAALREFLDERPDEREERLLPVLFAERFWLLERVRLLA